MPLVAMWAVLIAAEPGYVDANVCRSCHSSIFDSYQRTGMGRSFGEVKNAPPGGSYFHAASKREYFVTRRGEAYFLRRTSPPFEKRMDLVVGSGNHSQTFLHRDSANRLIELPLSWYSEGGGKWRMSPGYDRPEHSDFSRDVPDTCLFCHNGYPSDANGDLAQGIDCQRCHGPGEQHSRNPRSSITNPAKLTRHRQLEVCLQCHLESGGRTLPDAIRRFDRTAFSYRPGEPLSEFMVYFEFVTPPSDQRMTVNGAGYGLLKSKCFLQSGGSLTCSSCHDPHRAIPAAETEQHYRAACRSCHAKQHSSTTRDCVGCHMQKRRTEDAVHVIMTDHRIHRLSISDGLAPLSERHDRFAGRVRLLYPPELPDTPMERIYLALANQDAPGLRNELSTMPVPFAEPYFRLGEMLRQAGQFADALTELRRAIRLSPQDARPYVLAAELMMNRRETDAAIELLEPGLAQVSDRIPMLNSLSILYVARDRLDDALRLLNEAIQVRPDDAMSWLNLGVCLEAKRDLRGAAAAYTQSLSIDPASTRAMQYLRRVSTDRR